MNSHNDQGLNIVDMSLRRVLKNWISRESPPVDTRARLLYRASMRNRRLSQMRLPDFWERGLERTVLGNTPSNSFPELSQWLFAQAMVDSLGIERPQVHFVR